MSYTLTLHLDTSEKANLVEFSVWNHANGGTWDIGKPIDPNRSLFVLTLGGSGTSGMLRFQLSTGELFAIAVGIDNNWGWSGVAVDLLTNQTLAVLHGEYYNDGPRSSPVVRDSSATSKTGQKVSVTYNQVDGAPAQTYDADISVVGPGAE